VEDSTIVKRRTEGSTETAEQCFVVRKSCFAEAEKSGRRFCIVGGYVCRTLGRTAFGGNVGTTVVSKVLASSIVVLFSCAIRDNRAKKGKEMWWWKTEPFRPVGPIRNAGFFGLKLSYLHHR
jgi:hypothetical protein